MSYTLTELRTGVGYWLHETGVVGGLSGGLDSAETLYFINEALKDVLRMFPVSNESIGLKTATINIVSGTELYSLETDFQWMKLVEGAWHSGSVVSDRFPIWPLKNPEERVKYYNLNANATEGAPLWYYLEMLTASQKIGFVPVPGFTRSAYIKYWYWPKTTKLTTGADTILTFLEDYHALIEIKAAIKILSASGKDFSNLVGEHHVQTRDLKRNIAALEQQTPKQPRNYDDGYFDE